MEETLEREEEDREVRSKEDPQKSFEAPDLQYLPPTPKSYQPKIGLVGCGGIAPYHLRAYRDRGWEVTALADINLQRAQELRDKFFPDAKVYTDYQDILKRDDVEVMDIATHPEIRVAMVEAALNARKHVLSQKPFVMHLDDGERLCALAAKQDVKLAVNQNGRWAPHFSYIRAAVAQGLIGTPIAAHLSSHWDHNWTADTVFDSVKHLILFDFAIHWYDILGTLLPGQLPQRVYASTAVAPGQKAKPSLLAQVSNAY